MDKNRETSEQYIMSTYGKFDIVLEKGEGCYLYDEKGKKYLDFCAGIATNSLGYQHPVHVTRIKEQVEKMIHVSNLYYTKPQIELAKKLIDYSKFDKVFFCNSGTEANEAAIKLARKWGKKQVPEKNRIITMTNGFHGRTLGALSATAQEKYQEAFKPLLPGFTYVPFNDFEALMEVVAEDVCAIMLEVIQGEGGIILADRTYLEKVGRLCKEKNILLIVDEVQTGVGRCGALFAHELYQVAPDIITLAKGLGGGVPIGAMLATERVNVFEKGDHGATFGGNPLATAAATVVMEELMERGLLEHVKEVGSYLKNQLEAIKEECSMVKAIRGEALMCGIELTEEARPIMNKCMEEGLIVVGSGTHIIRFLPPLIVTKEQVDVALAILRKILLGL